MTETLVSVVIPVHNGRRFLGEAIESALAQDYRPLEIVVVDDGSDDGSAEIARALGVQCLSQPKGGAASARNAGVAASSGELIAFLDHDDLMPPGAISARAGPMLARPELGYVHGYVQVIVEGDASPPPRFDGETWKSPQPIPVPGSWLVRREVFDTVGGFDPAYAFSDDGDWLLRVRRASIAGELVPELVLLYRQHGTNMTRDLGPARAEMFRLLRVSGRTRP